MRGVGGKERFESAAARLTERMENRTECALCVCCLCTLYVYFSVHSMHTAKCGASERICMAVGEEKEPRSALKSFVLPVRWR